MPDRLILRGMVFYGYHGVFASEKELGQRYEVDLELSLDLSQPGRTDNLGNSVNYVDIYQRVKEIVENCNFNLLEALAETIAETVLTNYPPETVTVRVRKPQPPAGGLMETFEVELIRGKQ